MYSDVENVGMSIILEKKQFINTDQKFIYYEVIDSCCGYIYKDRNLGTCFVSLSNNIGSVFKTKYDSKEKFLAFFTSFTNIKNKMKLEEFMLSTKEMKGCFMFYDNNGYQIIDDDELIRQIKNSQSNKKDFDENVLNEGSDISQMYSEIKKTIISQDEQIMKILTTLFKNQKVVNSDFDIDLIGKLKENLIIYGSTGTGKTEILKRIAKIYKVPIVIEDATSLTETGYVGRNIQDMLNDLYLSSGKNIELAEKGILVIDEFDKLAEKNSESNHVSKEGVQRSLLKLLDGTEYYFDGVKFDTSKLSVVALGAFTGITKNDDYTNITTKDFVDYGIMRELMGRFSKLVAMNKLSKEDIKKILFESNFSPINTYKKLFESMNIEFTYEDDFIDYVAENAVALNSGARSLKTVFDDIISSAMFRIFAGDYSSIHLVKPSEEHDKSYVLTKKR